MKQKKKQSRSLKSQEPSVDSSPSPRFLSLIRSKLSGGRELKLIFRKLGRKKTSDGTPQARLVRCPKCHKILQEPDAPLYRCGRCDTVLQAKHWKSEGEVAQISDNSVQDAILLSAEDSDDFRADDESEEDAGSVISGSKSSVKKGYHVYDAAASSSGARSYDSETAYKPDKSDVRRGKLPVTGDPDMRVLGRSSPYSTVSSSVASGDWIQQVRYGTPPRAPFYPASPSPSSVYECASPFHAPYASAASEHTYHHHHQQNRYGQYESEGWSGETSGASSVHFSGETMDARYYQWSGQSSPLRDFQYQGFPGQSFYDYSSSCMATPHRSEYSYSAWSSKSESCGRKGTFRDVNGNVGERTPAVKRHVLPAAGGAPFVTCSYCLQLLQLSQEFLQDKRKGCLVRCSGCSGVLKFSLKEKPHTVSFTPSMSDSRPSRADNNVSYHQDDQDSASVHHEDNFPDEEDPLSCSNNDCGDFVCKRNLSNDGELQVVAVNEDEQRISNEFSDTMPGTELQPKTLTDETQRLGENPESDKTSGIRLDQSEDANSEHSRTECENSHERHELENTIDGNVRCDLEEIGYEGSEDLGAGKEATDGSSVSVIMEDTGYNNEETNETTEEAETNGDRLVSHGLEPANEIEITCEALEPIEKKRATPELGRKKSREEGCNMAEMRKLDLEMFQGGEGEYGGERRWGEDMGDRPGLHLEEYESNYEDIQEQLHKDSKWTTGAERVPTFRLDKSELGKMFQPGEAIEDRTELYLWGSLHDHEVSSDALGSDDYAEDDYTGESYLEEFPEEGEDETKSIEAVGTLENESRNMTETVDPRTEEPKLCLGGQSDEEEETLAEMLFHLDLSQDTLENPKQTLEPGAAEEDGSDCSSRLSSDDHECSGKMIKLVSETAEPMQGEHLEQMQDVKDKMGVTFEPYAHICSTTDPSEVVGLRHALYTTQSSPLRSPLTSPIHTPGGSPRGYPMTSPLHSPLASPLHPHILSPLRSPINSSPSLSDALFFGKNS